MSPRSANPAGDGPVEPGDVEDRRGEPFVGPAGRLLGEALAPRVLATVHPSSVLRAGDEQRRIELERLVDDLAVAATALP